MAIHFLEVVSMRDLDALAAALISGWKLQDKPVQDIALSCEIT